MYSAIGLLKKPAGVETEEWRTWWRERHVPHVLRFPGLRHYTIYPIEKTRVSVNPDEFSTDVPYDGVAIITFDSEEAFHAAIASDDGIADKNHLRTFTEEVLVLFGPHEEKFTTQAWFDHSLKPGEE